MSQSEPTPCLSVVMPCYNEISTISECIDAVMASKWVGELIVVDDGSSDGTREFLHTIDHPRVKTVFKEQNGGKGSALQVGFAKATFDFVIIQDADLEYDPKDYEKILAPLLDNKADVVFGSRFAGGDAHRVVYFWHSVGNKFLTLLSNAFTNLNLSDMETCYKCFKREIIQGIKLQENRFGIEPELTGKVAAGRWRIYEVGISYSGRTYDEGKKIGWKDGFRAIYCIIKYAPRFIKKRS